LRTSIPQRAIEHAENIEEDKAGCAQREQKREPEDHCNYYDQ
jgi:hypothetical protein